LRVAVASRNGIFVDEHFGHATRFEICELAGWPPRLVEVRHNEAACGAAWRADGVDPMQASAALVADCKAVLVVQIGDCGVARLAEHHILPFETEDKVEVALRLLAESADLYAHGPVP